MDGKIHVKEKDGLVGCKFTMNGNFALDERQHNPQHVFACQDRKTACALHCVLHVPTCFVHMYR